MDVRGSIRSESDLDIEGKLLTLAGIRTKVLKTPENVLL